MNKQKQQQEKRQILNQIRHSSLCGNKTNHFYAYASETEDHIRCKFEVWLKLRKAGYEVWCEPIFDNGIRMDILAWKDGIFVNYEILKSETTEKFLAKTKSYPSEIEIIPVRTSEDINNLELL
jgi:hypothetical protein